MSELLGIFAHDILPIFFGIACGFLFGLRFKPDVQVLSRVTFYIFSPSLVFNGLVHSSLVSDELLQLVLFTVLVTLIVGSLGLLIARVVQLDASTTRGLLLVIMFVNGGNYGLGVVERAFGEAGLARAIVYFTTSTVLVYTVGVAIAAGGNGRGLRGVVRNVFSVPPVYAALGALLLRGAGIDLATSALEPIAAGIEVLAGASIPCMLIILGIQLSRTSIASDLRLALAAGGIRLVLGSLSAFGVAALLGLNGLAQQAAIVEASMPSAVITIILATEYGAAPALVTSTVLLSTLLSPLTLIPILSLLK